MSALLMLAESVTPVTQAITFAVVGGFFALVTLLVTNRSKTKSAEVLRAAHETDEAARRREKADDLAATIAKEGRDYARQDEVQRRADAATRATLGKLRDVEDLGKVTHALVNSDKTAAMRERRDGWRITLALMREVISLKEAQGHQVSAESKEAITELEQRIVTLSADIDDRLRQQEAAEAAVATDQAHRPTGTPGTEADVLAQAVVAVTDAARLPAWPAPS